MAHKSGFVALVGRPNVGKSTLMNYLIGEQIAITSNKPQTTRNRISGIYTEKDLQAIFVDTPGVFKPHSKLDQYMGKASLNNLTDVDLILFMVEPESLGQGDQYIYDQLKESKTPVFLVINKVDQIHPDKLLPLIDEYSKLDAIKEIIPISARKGLGIPELIKALKKYLPEGPQYYDNDQMTDRPEYFIVGELIREQILHLTGQEVPHATAVFVEQMNEYKQGKLQVIANIYVERPGQKGIIVGKGASKLKQIGINSRKKIEALLGEKVNLKLWVKVQKDWREDANFLKQIGYDPKDVS
ncbi:MAG: GTPase Era [Lactobacillus sp.]|nr:GTPase Era [Lactobacillus sp.]